LFVLLNCVITVITLLIIISPGILGVATAKINEAIAKTKQSIEDSIDDNIVALHIKQNGPEPEVDPLEPRMICRLLRFDMIEVYLYR
jgi:hypothetical protein